MNEADHPVHGGGRPDRVRRGHGRLGPRQSRPTAAAKPAAKAAVLPKLPAEIATREAADRGRQVRHTALRVPRRPGEELGLRHRDREVARPVRLRPRAASVVRLRADRGARAAADHEPRRPRHLDVHVHSRPGHADRLLPRVLQGDRPAAGEELVADPEPERHPRQEGGHDDRLDLRPLDEALLLGHPGGGDGQRHQRHPRPSTRVAPTRSCSTTRRSP